MPVNRKISVKCGIDLSCFTIMSLQALKVLTGIVKVRNKQTQLPKSPTTHRKLTLLKNRPNMEAILSWYPDCHGPRILKGVAGFFFFSNCPKKTNKKENRWPL